MSGVDTGLEPVPKPLEPLTPSIAEENQRLLDDELKRRLERLKAQLKPRELRRLQKRHRALWRRLNRAHYNDLASERASLWAKYTEACHRWSELHRQAETDAAAIARMAAIGRKIAERGRSINAQLKPLEPLFREYSEIDAKLRAHSEAVAFEIEEQQNRDAFAEESKVWLEQIRAVFRQKRDLHHVGKDKNGRDFIEIPEIEHIWIKTDRVLYQIRVTRQNAFQRWRGMWTSALPYGVIPAALMSEETLQSLSIHTDRRVTIERGAKGQTIFYSVSRVDSPDGIPAKVLFSSLVQLYPREQHADTPWLAGVGIDRTAEFFNFEEQFHILIGGSPGGGKSNFLNQMIAMLVTMNTPEELRILLIDNKGGVEFTHWETLPHLIGPMIDKAENVLDALVEIEGVMMRRLAMFKKVKAKKLSEYNEIVKPEDRLPRIEVIIDEMATLLGIEDEEPIQDSLRNISSIGRAAGVHVVLCTQHVSVNVVRGWIKTNMGLRVSFKMPSHEASALILDTKSAVELPPVPGRAVFSLGRIERVIQTPFISSAEIASALSLASKHPKPYSREFEARETFEPRARFDREDFLALALEGFAGKMVAEDMHKAAGGNDVITLRGIRELRDRIKKEGPEIEFRGVLYKIEKDRKASVLRPIDRTAERNPVKLQ